VAFRPTAEQAHAIAVLSGDLSISAGAGSGKTRVLAERFVAAVDGAAPVAGWAPADVGEVLVVTFTEKAAGEIAERVRRVLLEHGLIEQARRVDEAWISTIHGLCTRLLRTHALAAGLDPRFAVLSAPEAEALRGAVFEELLRERLAEGTATAIVATYGVSGAVELVADLHDRLMAMGATTADVTVEAPPDPRAVLDAARVAARRWVEMLTACPAPGLTVRRLIAESMSAAEELDALDDVRTDSDDLIGHEVLRILHALTLKGNVGGAKEAVEACKRERAAVLDGAVLAVAAPLERALLDLATDFRERFDAAKSERAVLDYDDLQLLAVALLGDRHGPATRYRSLFRLVMIDEFQDTNEVQTRLADLLSDGDLCTVGDARQSVYSFRYADVDVYRAHTERMLASGAATAELAANFRSHGDVLAFVNAVFADPVLFGDGFLRLEHGRDEELTPPLVPPGTPRVELVAVDRSGRSGAGARAVEADAVAARLRALADSGVPQGEMVVLLRAMTHADEYAAALDRHGLDYTITAGGTFFGRPEVEAMRAFLRAAANPLDDSALAHVLASDMGGVSDDALMRLRLASDREPLWGSMDAEGLGAADREAVRSVRRALLAARSLEGRASVAEMVHRACEDLDYDLHLIGGGPDGRRAYANILKLARLAGHHERAGGSGIASFLEYLALKERTRDREAPAAIVDEQVDAVRVMTIHAAKGLEFPVVAVPELGRDLRADTRALVLEKNAAGATLALSLPDEDDSPAEERRSRWASQARDRARAREAEEEKRLLYVACTRAREALVLSGAADLSKPADARPLGWFRAALGIGDADVSGGVIQVGGVPVSVRRLDGDGEITGAPSRIPIAPRGPRGDPSRAAEVCEPTPPTTGTPPAVSHSSVALYETCPFRYHAEKVLRIVRVCAASEDDPLRFGDAVHAALRLVGPAGEPPARDRVAAIARGWNLTDAGRTRLDTAVDGFLRSGACSAAYSAGAPSREVPFAVPLEGMTLVGKLDLLVMRPEDALVLDYKTGKEAAGADSRDAYHSQAETYALAVLAGGARGVDVVFVGVETSERGAPREVAFRYEQADTGRLRASIQRRTHGLLSGPYRPLDRYEPGACDACPAAGGICPVRVPVRRAR
jgi:ATP-dependent helicase/nuclease subunit A